MSILIFVSYSHEDAMWFDREARNHCLVPWLADSLRRDEVEFWWDREGIEGGDRFQPLIEQKIDEASVALLLISGGFLNSDFIRDVELKRIEERAETGALIVIPILLEPCLWEELEFVAQRQMVPGRPTPLVDFIESPRQWAHARDEVLRSIKSQLRRIRGEAEPASEREVTVPSVPTGVDTVVASPAVHEAPAESDWHAVGEKAQADTAEPPVPVRIIAAPALERPPVQTPPPSVCGELACDMVLTGYSYMASAVALVDGGLRLLAGGSDLVNPETFNVEDVVRVWDLQRGTFILHYPGESFRLAATPDGRRLISGGGHELLLWHLGESDRPEVLDESTSVYCLAITRDGRRAVQGGHPGLIQVWDLDRRSVTCVPAGHDRYAVGAVAMTSDGRLVASGSTDHTARLWDGNTGACIWVYEGHTNNVDGLAFVAEGTELVSAGLDGDLCNWDVRSGKLLRKISVHVGLNELATTPDGKYGLIGCSDKIVRLWDLEAGECLYDLTGNTDDTYAVDISADARIAVSAGSDKTIRVWHLPPLPSG